MFPKFKYHKEKGAVLLKSKEQEAQLGKEWKDSPADFGVETHPQYVAPVDEYAFEKMVQPKAKAK